MYKKRFFSVIIAFAILTAIFAMSCEKKIGSLNSESVVESKSEDISQDDSHEPYVPKDLGIGEDYPANFGELLMYKNRAGFTLKKISKVLYTANSTEYLLFEIEVENSGEKIIMNFMDENSYLMFTDGTLSTTLAFDIYSYLVAKRIYPDSDYTIRNSETKTVVLPVVAPQNSWTELKLSIRPDYSNSNDTITWLFSNDDITDIGSVDYK